MADLSRLQRSYTVPSCTVEVPTSYLARHFLVSAPQRIPLTGLVRFAESVDPCRGWSHPFACTCVSRLVFTVFLLR